jgi:hypothetical protein
MHVPFALHLSSSLTAMPLMPFMMKLHNVLCFSHAHKFCTQARRYDRYVTIETTAGPFTLPMGFLISEDAILFPKNNVVFGRDWFEYCSNHLMKYSIACQIHHVR